jgi:hypothetical protein
MGALCEPAIIFPLRASVRVKAILTSRGRLDRLGKRVLAVDAVSREESRLLDERAVRNSYRDLRF